MGEKLLRMIAGFIQANADRGLAKNVSPENAARIAG